MSNTDASGSSFRRRDSPEFDGQLNYSLDDCVVGDEDAEDGTSLVAI